ncbi:pre-mRNA-splicing factor ISY1 [Piromyces finnis]|uniref:Pre-mRNA-splicing factor ISY1 n=1 Tax=Piromyces finnis TaxID=1754191 RepID=A0A1Y1VLB0_9FUNG|nr:pre-mRNA-splicing factor ISY1 [Piromyces finnis]|eukprot:ORX58549.1 pre-mRNA-splicing factor ISY1 [Piromyces finnis]
MARNEEKAQSMLHRFREAQAIELGLLKKEEKRPYLATLCDNVKDCEYWRKQIIKEISKKVSKIQDDYQIRDLNDEINKLIREKYHWENRILELGGPNYKKIGQKTLDKEGKEVPGSRGYKYFGRARDLPGVRELFEPEVSEIRSKTRYELYQNIDADYYGYRDEEDDILLEYETELRKQYVDEILKEEGIENNNKDVNYNEYDFVEHLYIPSQSEVEKYLIEQKKEELTKKYLSEAASLKAEIEKQ